MQHYYSHKPDEEVAGAGSGDRDGHRLQHLWWAEGELTNCRLSAFSWGRHCEKGVVWEKKWNVYVADEVAKKGKTKDWLQRARNLVRISQNRSLPLPGTVRKTTAVYVMNDKNRTHYVVSSCSLLPVAAQLQLQQLPGN